MRGTRTSVKAAGRLGLDLGAIPESSALLALVLISACAYLVMEPWHGPAVLALSEQHGVDVADLPALVLIVLVVAGWHARARGERTQGSGLAGGRLAAVAVVVLGALLIVGIFNPRVGAPLVPAGGGTFGRTTEEIGGVRADPVGHWSHLAVTYDGATVRLYVDGVQASSSSESGTIRKTNDPLWIGGNRPYGEYFKGVIDEVRVYDRALGPAAVRAAMSTPIGDQGGQQVPGLVAAYTFDAGGGRHVTDDSGNGNTGTIRGARWTRSGRYGGGMNFDGDGEVIRVPASASLNLRKAMTLAAWIKPSESQSGWRTVAARQTDAYTLMAGGGRQDASRIDALDRVRFGLVILLIAGICLAFARRQTPWATGRRRWYWPVALFVAGSLVDVAFAHGDTLVGPALLALWCGATSSDRTEMVGVYALSAAFAAVTILSVAAPAALALPHDDGDVVRSAAVGLLLATVGALSVWNGLRHRGVPGSLRV